MNSPQDQPKSDSLLDGRDWQWIFKDEHGKKTPIVSCVFYEDKGIIELSAKPSEDLPEQKENSPKTSKRNKK